MLNDAEMPARLTGIKQWQAALSADEIKAEMRTIHPLRLANLHSWHPAIANNLTDALKDYSGNGRDWVSQGTNTVETQTPPVSWGAPPILVGHVTIAVQYARPNADISNTGWLPLSGSDLHPMVGETVRDDDTYIYTNTAGSLCELALSDVTDPATSADHLPSLVLSAPSGGGGMIVRLMEGASQRASWTYDPLPTTATLYQPELTGGEADSITDYGNLRYQFEATT